MARTHFPVPGPEKLLYTWCNWQDADVPMPVRRAWAQGALRIRGISRTVL